MGVVPKREREREREDEIFGHGLPSCHNNLSRSSFETSILHSLVNFSVYGHVLVLYHSVVVLFSAVYQSLRCLPSRWLYSNAIRLPFFHTGMLFLLLVAYQPFIIQFFHSDTFLGFQHCARIVHLCESSGCFSGASTDSQWSQVLQLLSTSTRVSSSNFNACRLL